MFRNYLLSALRSFKKRLSYSIINVFGLSLGVACFILIALWVQHELSYDTFHKDSHRIYRTGLYFSSGNAEMNTALSHSALLPAVMEAGKAEGTYLCCLPDRRPDGLPCNGGMVV